jgi:serine protease AprX
MISGLIADGIQYHPNWTPNQIKGALMTSWISDNSSVQIPDAMKLAWLFNPQPANQGLTPNNLITDAQGDIDYTRSTWSRSTWSTATGSLSAGFARSSWSCTCTTSGSGSTDPSRSTWSRSSWSTYFESN